MSHFFHGTPCSIICVQIDQTKIIFYIWIHHCYFICTNQLSIIKMFTQNIIKLSPSYSFKLIQPYFWANLYLILMKTPQQNNCLGQLAYCLVVVMFHTSSDTLLSFYWYFSQQRDFQNEALNQQFEKTSWKFLIMHCLK